MTTCPAVCDFAVQRKERLCNNPAPSSQQYGCQGLPEVVEICALENCDGKILKSRKHVPYVAKKINSTFFRVLLQIFAVVFTAFS